MTYWKASTKKKSIRPNCSGRVHPRVKKKKKKTDDDDKRTDISARVAFKKLDLKKNKKTTTSLLLGILGRKKQKKITKHALSRTCFPGLTWMLTLSMTQEMTWSTCIFVSHSVTCCNSWKRSPNMDSKYCKTGSWSLEIGQTTLSFSDVSACQSKGCYNSFGLNESVLTGRNCSVRNSKSSTGERELSKKCIFTMDHYLFA